MFYNKEIYKKILNQYSFVFITLIYNMNAIENEDFLDNNVFQHPFTRLMAGPTMSGKATILNKILDNHQLLIDSKIERIIYCYARWQDTYNKMQLSNSTIEFIQGLPDMELIDGNQNNLMILDDLMDQCENDKTILNLFTTDSHQKNISVFLITQNLFSQGKFARTISLNCHYLFLLNNPRDQSQIYFLARQMYPTNAKFLIECYSDAVENKKFGYLFLDLKQNTKKNHRVQTGVLPGEERIIYQIKT